MASIPLSISVDIATSLAIMGSTALFLHQVIKRRSEDAKDRMSEQARSVAISRIHSATERLAQLEFEIRLTRHDAQDEWDRKMTRKSYMDAIDDQEFEAFMDPSGMSPHADPVLLRDVPLRRLEDLSDLLKVFDPLLRATRDFSNEVNIQVHTISPFLKPAVTGAAKKENTLDQLFKNLGCEIETIYSDLKDGLLFMRNVDVALVRARAALSISSRPASEDWLSVKSHLRHSLTEKDLGFVASFIPRDQMDMPFNQIGSAADRNEHEREVVVIVSKNLAEAPETFISAGFLELLSINKRYEEVTERLLLLLSSVSQKLVSENGPSAVEIYADQEKLLAPKKS